MKRVSEPHRYLREGRKGAASVKVQRLVFLACLKNSKEAIVTGTRWMKRTNKKWGQRRTNYVVPSWGLFFFFLFTLSETGRFGRILSRGVTWSDLKFGFLWPLYWNWVEEWWKDRETGCLLIHVRDNSIVAAEEKCLGPGRILRNEPAGFLDRLDMEEDIKDEAEIWGS